MAREPIEPKKKKVTDWTSVTANIQEKCKELVLVPERQRPIMSMYALGLSNEVIARRTGSDIEEVEEVVERFRHTVPVLSPDDTLDVTLINLNDAWREVSESLLDRESLHELSYDKRVQVLGQMADVGERLHNLSCRRFEQQQRMLMPPVPPTPPAEPESTTEPEEKIEEEAPKEEPSRVVGEIGWENMPWVKE